MVSCQTAHLAISISSELGQKLPFLTIDLEARPAPLPVMDCGRDHDKRPWGRSPHRNGRQPPSRGARMDASFNRAPPLAKWGFTLCRCLPGLASCHDVDLFLLIGLGLHLLQPRWLLSCRGSFLPKRGSWIPGKAPLSHGRMVWWLLSVL
jgi:hypothetical protein